MAGIHLGGGRNNYTHLGENFKGLQRAGGQLPRGNPAWSRSTRERAVAAPEGFLAISELSAIPWGQRPRTALVT